MVTRYRANGDYVRRCGGSLGSSAQHFDQYFDHRLEQMAWHLTVTHSAQPEDSMLA